VSDTEQLAEVARAIIDANSYMTIGSADESGLPWVSPVWFAPVERREFFWVSDPDATHSRNIAARPQVSIVIFDSTVPIGTGQAVYMTATAEQLEGPELERGIEAFSHRSQERGGRPWTTADILAPAELRLYRATASRHWVLDPESSRDERTRVTI